MEVIHFRVSIAAAYQQLLAVAEGNAELPYRPGGWLRKQILGHLIDSALNNHQRFVRAALDGVYEGPGYQQDAWVSIHGYDSLPWRTLIQHWLLQNHLLAEVVDRIPPDKLKSPCRVGLDGPVTLRFLVEDYLTHLNHHLQQIVAPQ